MNFSYNDEENRLGLGAVDVKKMRRGSFFLRQKRLDDYLFCFIKWNRWYLGKN